MSEIDAAITQHVDDHHLGLPKEGIKQAFDEHNSLIDNGREMDRKLDMLVDDYFGPAETDVDGEVHRTGGLRKVTTERWEDQKAFNVEQKAFNRKVEGQLDNGGLHAKVKLSKGQLIGIFAALAPILAASITVLFR